MTIWFDYTTSLRNRGRSGIAAVEWQLGSALRAVGGDTEPIRSFVLDERDGLVEIDPAHRLSGAVYAEREQVAVLPAAERTGLRGALRSAVASMLGGRQSPGDEALVKLLGRIRATRAQARAAAQLRLPARRAAHRLTDRVTSDDVIVSMGAVWSGHLTKQLAEIRRQKGCRVVAMVFDLIPLTHTHLAFHADRDLFTAYYRRLIESSDLLTCISTRTEQDLIAFAAQHNLVCPPTVVIRLGDSATRPQPMPPSDRPFFLAVGTIERRKNLELLYDALRMLDQRGTPLPTVVVAGGPGWGVDDWLEEHGQHTTPASRAMVLLGAVDDTELDRLYWQADALVFPSQFEGWGLPLREAAVRGCPVAAGDSPAAREALGTYPGAVVLPIDDPEPWADYLSQAHRRVAPDHFVSWAESAERLLAAVSEIRQQQAAAEPGR